MEEVTAFYLIKQVLCIPYVCSVIVLRDPGKLIARPEDIITGEAHSFGQVTPFFGSRAFLSIKLYFLIKHLGLSGIGESVLYESLCQH